MPEEHKIAIHILKILEEGIFDFPDMIYILEVAASALITKHAQNNEHAHRGCELFSKQMNQLVDEFYKVSEKK